MEERQECVEGRHVALAEYFCKTCKQTTCKDCAARNHYEHIDTVQHQSAKLLELVNLLTTCKTSSAKALQFHSFGIRQNDVGKIEKAQEELIKADYRQYLGWVRDHMIAAYWKVRLCKYLKGIRQFLDDAKARQKEARGLRLEYLKRIRQVVLDSGPGSKADEQHGSVGEIATDKELKAQKDRTQQYLGLKKEVQAIGQDISKLGKIETRYTSASVSLAEVCQLDATGLTGVKLTYLRSNSRDMIIYYPDIGKSKTVHFGPRFSCPQNFTVLELSSEAGSWAYVMGGTRQNVFGATVFLDNVVALNLETYAVDHRAPLRVSRRKAAACTLGHKFIYIIGGDKENGCLDTCEEYDAEKNEWVLIPPLGCAKTNATACTVDEKFVYVFGGYGKDGELATIEVMEASGDKVWKPVDLGSTEGWTSRQTAGAIQISSTEILIYGGMRGGRLLNQSLLFKFKDRTVESGAEMHVADSLLHTWPMRSGPYVYSFGCHKQDIHVYNIISKVWNALPRKDWFPG